MNIQEQKYCLRQRLSVFFRVSLKHISLVVLSSNSCFNIIWVNEAEVPKLTCIVYLFFVFAVFYRMFFAFFT